jgi:hypothetical protein
VTPPPRANCGEARPDSHHSEFSRARTSVIRNAAPSNDDERYGSGGEYETGQTEVMRSVAERVKAARELAKRLASREEELAARSGS